MDVMCAACREAILHSDWFCPSCGTRLNPACTATWTPFECQSPSTPEAEGNPTAERAKELADDFHPLPMPETRRHSSGAVNRYLWYRRRWITYMVLASLAVILSMGVLIVVDPPFGYDRADGSALSRESVMEVDTAAVEAGVDPTAGNAIGATAKTGLRTLVSGASLAQAVGDEPSRTRLVEKADISWSPGEENQLGDGTGGFTVVGSRQSVSDDGSAPASQRSPSLEP